MSTLAFELEGHRNSSSIPRIGVTHTGHLVHKIAYIGLLSYSQFHPLPLVTSFCTGLITESGSRCF